MEGRNHIELDGMLLEAPRCDFADGLPMTWFWLRHEETLPNGKRWATNVPCVALGDPDALHALQPGTPLHIEGRLRFHHTHPRGRRGGTIVVHIERCRAELPELQYSQFISEVSIF